MNGDDKSGEKGIPMLPDLSSNKRLEPQWYTRCNLSKENEV